LTLLTFGCPNDNYRAKVISLDHDYHVSNKKNQIHLKILTNNDELDQNIKISHLAIDSTESF